MSGIRPKGPERPNQKKESTKKVRAPPPPEEVAAAGSSSGGDASSPPPLTNKPFLEGKTPKLLMLGASIVIGIMFIVAFSLCLAEGIKKKRPRYFLLLINIILSTAVTGLLIFWYYRRILQPTLIWYVFLQCLFLFFQCVTTDIFAFYERPHTSSTNHHGEPLRTLYAATVGPTPTPSPNSSYFGL